MLSLTGCIVFQAFFSVSKAFVVMGHILHEKVHIFFVKFV